MATPFRTIITGQADLDQIQQNIVSAFNRLTSPYLGGNLITGISLTASTPLVINHGLARQPAVWTLGDITAAAEVYRTAWNSNTITLEATANCTIALWIN